MTREKEEAELFETYNSALDLLGSGEREKGVEKLAWLLSNPLLGESEFVRIRYGAHYSLGQVYSELERLNEGLYHYSRAVELKCEWQTLRAMGLVCRRLGLLPKALNLMLKAVSQCSQSALHAPLLY